MGSRGRQASLLRAFFGQPTTGRLARLPFLGFWVLLWVLFVLYGTGIAFGIGVVEPLIVAGPAAARDALLGRLGLPVLALLGLCCLLFLYGQVNLLAKRIRDIGLPGWSVLLLVALIATGFAAALPPGGAPGDQGSRVDGTYQGLLLLALLLIPSGLFPRAGASRLVEGPVGNDAPVGGGPLAAPTPEPSSVATPASASASERGQMDQDRTGGVQAE